MKMMLLLCVPDNVNDLIEGSTCLMSPRQITLDTSDSLALYTESFESIGTPITAISSDQSNLQNEQLKRNHELFELIICCCSLHWHHPHPLNKIRELFTVRLRRVISESGDQNENMQSSLECIPQHISQIPCHSIK